MISRHCVQLFALFSRAVATLRWSAYRGTSAFAKVEGGRGLVALNLSTRLVRRSPLPCVLRTLPEPLRVILGGVGDSIDRFGAGFLPRQQRQYLLHSFNRRLMCLIAATCVAYLAISQACAAPSG